MRVHVLGICGTFMGGLALIARELGHEVTGSDAGVYPPMSTMLADAGIDVHEGWDPGALVPAPDLVVIGNSLSRGNPAVEHVLRERLPYTSGPQWLYEQALAGRRVAAIAGTHGKTTTTAMVAWILETAGMAPGFLVGGLPPGFGSSARIGDGDWFVIEADEYDTAFFDKRSKFVHYRPEVLLINNLEFDHADIFPDLAAIERQFHHCVRTVPDDGLVLRGLPCSAIDSVLRAGCWTPVQSVGPGGDWVVELLEEDGSAFRLQHRGQTLGEVRYALFGPHNADNACAAAAVCRHAGVSDAGIVAGLASFEAPKRRLELLDTVNHVAVYDDFAHHPTAVRLSIASMRQRLPGARLIAVLEPRSNTMRMGVHREALADSLADADRVHLFRPEGLAWDLEAATAALGERRSVHADHESLVTAVAAEARPGDVILVMSNGGFGGVHRRIIEALRRGHGGKP